MDYMEANGEPQAISKPIKLNNRTNERYVPFILSFASASVSFTLY